MELTESLALEINEKVKKQYETYPYPDYSFFIPLRTQEAYASHSLFAAQLMKETGGHPIRRTESKSSIFVAGSGDVLPYILSFWEPESTEIHAYDLSEKNIARARLRSTFRPHHFVWKTANLEDLNEDLPKATAHVDSYGVLHHLARPELALNRLADSLKPGGTMRVMVYNSKARDWIHEIQTTIRLLGLSAYDAKDLNHALTLLKTLMTISPRYRQRLEPMKSGIFHHSARFVDTFFHEHEGRMSLRDWLDAFAKAELKVLGLFDRYGELDDLPNPLLTAPRVEELEERISDRRFENNFEFYLCKEARGETQEEVRLPQETRWWLKTPPSLWFSYLETHSVPLGLRFRLWRNFVKTLTDIKAPTLDDVFPKLETKSWQRLARLGAVFPSNFSSPEMKKILNLPMQAMEPPDFAEASSLVDHQELRKLLEKIIHEKKRDLTVLDSIMKRLDAGQTI